MSTFEIIDKRFRSYILFNAALERIADGCRWTEGPVWFGDAGCLLFSDIPNDRILRWTEGVGVSVYRQPSQFSNGGTRDREGRLISCLHGARAVVRTEHDGRLTTLADRYGGLRLNSPNDVVVKSDGTIWFTDPHYGIAMDYEGSGQTAEELPCQVYRLDPQTGQLDVVSDGFACPNGICFSPDERRLYVAETGRLHDDSVERQIRVFDVLDEGSGRLGNEREFYAPSVGSGGRVPLRRGRQRLDQCRRRRALREPGRRPAGPDPGAADRVQRHLRRPQQQPPVHLRHHRGVCGLSASPGCRASLTPREPEPAGVQP